MHDEKGMSKPYQKLSDIPFVSYCQPLGVHLPQLGRHQSHQRSPRQILQHPVKYEAQRINMKEKEMTPFSEHAFWHWQEQ